MARKIKVYSTAGFPAYKWVNLLHKLGAPKHKQQFQIICGATSLDKANQLCSEQGLGYRIFTRSQTYITANAQAISLAGNGGIFIELTYGKWYSLEQLREQQE